MTDPHGLAAQARWLTKCPSCGAGYLRCFTREAEVGRWCCGDCTAHHGEHDWNAYNDYLEGRRCSTGSVH